MSLSLQADPLPLKQDEHGAIRVGDTRVLLELVIHAHQGGATAEEIVKRFTTLDIADVHAVIAYYLRHRQEVEDYMNRRDAEAAEIRKRIEQEMPLQVTKKELLARWRAKYGSDPCSDS